MRTTPPVVKCEFCGNDTRLSIGHTYYSHKDPEGFFCMSSGDTRDQAIQRRRTFRDKSMPAHAIEVFDSTDSIGFHSRNTGDNHRVETWVYLPGNDVRRLIAELTEIADARGL